MGEMNGPIRNPYNNTESCKTLGILCIPKIRLIHDSIILIAHTCKDRIAIKGYEQSFIFSQGVAQRRDLVVPQTTITPQKRNPGNTENRGSENFWNP